MTLPSRYAMRGAGAVGPCGSAFAETPPRVEVEGGAGSASVGTLASYKGIPFAAPPVRELRWRAPQPVAAWQGDLVADRFAPMCLQPLRPKNSVFYPGEEASSEDCLYLNVWSTAAGRRQAAGHGLRLWRRLDHRLGLAAALWRRRPGRQGRGRRLVQLSRRRAGLPRPPRADGRRRRRLGQLRPDGHDRGARMGEGQYRAVRRRSGERHALRPVGGLGGDLAAGDVAAGGRPVPSRHRPERRLRDGRSSAVTGRGEKAGVAAAEKLKARVAQGAAQSRRRRDPERRQQLARPIVDGALLPRQPSDLRRRQADGGAGADRLQCRRGHGLSGGDDARRLRSRCAQALWRGGRRDAPALSGEDRRGGARRELCADARPHFRRADAALGHRAVEVAPVFMYHFSRVHPFVDGSASSSRRRRQAGRLSRRRRWPMPTAPTTC